MKFQAIRPLIALLFLVLTSAGWGTLLLRTLAPSRSLPPTRFGRALAPVAGLAVFTWLLQWLAYFQLFTPMRAAGIAVVGCGLLFPELPRLRAIARQKLSIAVPAAVIVAIVVSALIVYIPPALNSNDDTRAYLLFPLKIKALGGIGWEPFSERRLFSLGAHYPLQALSLSWLPIDNLGIIEPTLGVVLIVLTAAILGTPLQTLLCAILLWLMVLSGSRFLANLAPLYLMVPPLLLILRANQSRMKMSPGFASVFGIIGGFAVALRPTVAPFAAFMLVWTFLRATESRVARCLAAAASAAAIFALPFSLDLVRSGGTFLFPVLGRGFHATANGSSVTVASLNPLSAHLANMLGLPAKDPFLLFALVLALVTLRLTSGHIRTDILAACAAALATCGIIIYQTSGTNAAHYWAPTILALAIHCLITLEFPRFPVRPAALTGLVAIGLLFACLFGPRFSALALEKLAVRQNTLSPSPGEVSTYRNLQNATPPGATILAGLNRNDLFDLRRNRILVNDQPGMTSPPPGWPADKSGVRLAQYLRSQGIHYVAVLRNDLSPTAMRQDLIRPLRDWEDILVRAYTGIDIALADLPFRDSIVFETDSMRLYRVPLSTVPGK